jgi:hypothetical protein
LSIEEIKYGDSMASAKQFAAQRYHGVEMAGGCRTEKAEVGHE